MSQQETKRIPGEQKHKNGWPTQEKQHWQRPQKRRVNKTRYRRNETDKRFTDKRHAFVCSPIESEQQQKKAPKERARERESERESEGESERERAGVGGSCQPRRLKATVITIGRLFRRRHVYLSSGVRNLG